MEELRNPSGRPIHDHGDEGHTQKVADDPNTVELEEGQKLARYRGRRARGSRRLAHGQIEEQGDQQAG